MQVGYIIIGILFVMAVVGINEVTKHNMIVESGWMGMMGIMATTILVLLACIVGFIWLDDNVRCKCK